MSLEKQGNFEVGKSYTDDGTGEKARIVPKGIDHLIFSYQNKDLTKKASPKQRSIAVDGLLEKDAK